MARFFSVRDFDWVLLVFVLVICGLGIMEIYSATYSTKFAGVHTKQVYWIMAGVVLMFLISLINYHALLDKIHWFYIASVVSLVAADGHMAPDLYVDFGSRPDLFDGEFVKIAQRADKHIAH